MGLEIRFHVKVKKDTKDAIGAPGLLALAQAAQANYWRRFQLFQRCLAFSHGSLQKEEIVASC